MGDEGGNDVEETSGYEKSGVRLALFGVKELMTVSLLPRSGVVPPVSGMVY
jgi:hypothetical protein